MIEAPFSLPRYFGSVDYYALVAAGGGMAHMDGKLRFDKRQKQAHRCEIADTRGRLTLTVPIEHPATSRVVWDQVRVSTHGSWWDVHLAALESAYGRTPYFEFYIDRFMPVFRGRTAGDCETVTELDGFIDREIRRILDIAPARACESEARAEETTVAVVPYYQVRARKLGFLPGLSVLDLIFNMGPESQLVLDRMTGR